MSLFCTPVTLFLFWNKFICNPLPFFSESHQFLPHPFHHPSSNLQYLSSGYFCPKKLIQERRKDSLSRRGEAPGSYTMLEQRVRAKVLLSTFTPEIGNQKMESLKGHPEPMRNHWNLIRLISVWKVDWTSRDWGDQFRGYCKPEIMATGWGW